MGSVLVHKLVVVAGLCSLLLKAILLAPVMLCNVHWVTAQKTLWQDLVPLLMLAVHNLTEWCDSMHHWKGQIAL